MKKGDLVLIPFPFTDLRGVKNCPALVLIVTTKDVTVSFLSTHISNQQPADILLQPSSENGLKKESVIRLNKIAALDRNLILGKLGNLTVEEIKVIDSNLIELFRINPY